MKRFFVRTRKVDVIVLVLGFLANIVEKVATIYAVHVGAEEKNPFIRFLLPTWGLYASLAIAGLVVAFSLYLSYEHREENPWPLWIVSGLYVLMATWNVLMIVYQRYGAFLMY